MRTNWLCNTALLSPILLAPQLAPQLTPLPASSDQGPTGGAR